MLSGISLVCFAASYTVSLGLELTRLAFRSRVRHVAFVTFGMVGFVVHTIYLANRAREEMMSGLPLSSWYDWCLLAAWALVLIYLIAVIMRPHLTLGLFLLPLVLLLLTVAWILRDLPAFSQDHATRVWGLLHGFALLLGTVIVVIGFVAGVMYLVQANRLKRKLSPRLGLVLPSLELLQQANIGALITSSCLIVLGLSAGIVLNLVRHTSEQEHTPWTDPVVWSSELLLVWLFAALLFNWLYKPARQGRKVAYLTVASFLFVILAVGLALFAKHASREDNAGPNDPHSPLVLSPLPTTIRLVYPVRRPSPLVAREVPK